LIRLKTILLRRISQNLELMNYQKSQEAWLCNSLYLFYRKSKERAKRNRAIISRKTYKNYKRYEDEKHLKEENLVLVSCLFLENAEETSKQQPDL